MSSCPLHKTAWVIHYQFADKTQAPWRERRLACVKKRDDDGIVIGKGAEVPDEGNIPNGGDVPPWQAAKGFRERIYELATPTLINDLAKHAKSEKALQEYLQENQKEIFATVYQKGGHSLKNAGRVYDAISQHTMRPADIHQMIEKLIAPQPEKDTALEDALIVHAPEKGESQEKKQTRWQKLLAHVATLTHPLYRRLSSFLGNKTVLGIGISIDSIFEDLRDKNKRLSLFRRLASLRHDLVLENAASVGDRQQALEDLQAILYHGQFMLGEGEKAEFYELYSRVSAAKLMVEEEGERYAQEKMQPKEKMQSDALAESETIRKFLINEQGHSSVIRGEEGLLARLQKQAHELGDENPFSILAQGLSKNEWLGALRVPEHLKYTCILFALEEIAALKHDVGLNKRHDTMNLLDRMKSTIIQLLQRGTRGFPEESAGTIYARHGTLPIIRRNFEELQKKISRVERPSRADIDEILLLYTWLSHNDNQFDADSGMRLKIEVWRENAEATSAELQNEAADARRDLAESLTDTSPLRADVLRDAGLEVLLSALAEVEEEKAIEENRTRLARYFELLSPEKRHKVDREPPLLHKVCDDEYAEKRLRRVRELVEKNVSLAAVNEDSVIIALDEEHKKERMLRLHMHGAFIESQEAKILAVLEADIRAKSAGLQESFSKKIGERMKERLKLRNADVPELARTIEKMEWDQLPGVLAVNEMETTLALGTLKTLSLRNQKVPSEAARIALEQLNALKEDVEDADERMREREEKILASQESAQRIVDDPETPEELKTIVAPVARGEVKIAGGTAAQIRRLEDRRVKKAIAPVLGEVSDTDSEDLALLDDRLRSVKQRIDAILPSYLGERGDDLGQRAKEKIDGELKNLARSLKSGVIAGVKTQIDALESCVHILEKNKEEYEELDEAEFATYIKQEPTLRGKPQYIFGVYNRREKKIVLNKAAIDHYGSSAREVTLLHERRHAFHDALREIFPAFLTDAYDQVHLKSAAIEQRGKELMPKEGLTEEVWKDEVMDEVLVRAFVEAEKGEEMKRKGKEFPPGMLVGAKDRALFEALGKSTMPLEFETLLTKRKGRLLVAEDADNEEVPAAPAARSSVATAERGPNFQPPPFKEGSEVTTNFEFMRQGFIKIESFMKSNDFYDTAKNQASLATLRERKENLEEEFRRNMYAEEDEGFINRVQKLKDDIGAITKAINTWDAEQRDLRDAPQKPTFWHALTSSIEFMSINDFVSIAKAIGEDIKRKHHRREQGRIGRVGISLTEWIGNTWGLKEIPYINTLSAEFLRREKSAEQEEVENWKKSLEELDSYELLAILHHPSNPDHMKAILLLLSERGRMDWSDTEFWKALNNFSYYKMPIPECQRDENLRDDWLRKLMSDVFDKDFFRNIRTKNGAGIRSGMETFSGEVDRLSNMDEGMENELAKQLKIYVHAKHHHEEHIPDDVQPHLYEAIIIYAMKNGKMSMEDKFFYLVQGIAEGIIPRDRLAVMAGEGGEGLLNIFPFIDYFYKRNNTIFEIRALARRLREDDNWEHDDYYKPGPKTTRWLELEVAREESVQKRLSKGMIKRGQEADHDDMHFFIPRLDAKTVDQLTLPAGGARPQLSDQAWMNAYTGFNSYFKSFGMVAQLENEGLGKFTSTDTQDIIRSIATFVRMDGIMTQRSAFGDSDARRMTLPWGKLRTQKSVVNTKGDVVYEERKRVDAFVKSVIAVYGLHPDYIRVMLYDTEKSQPYDKNHIGTGKTDDKVYELSNKFETELRKEILSQGAGKLKDLLMEHEPGFSSHAKKYNYDFVRKEAEKEKHAASHSATAAEHSPH